MTLIVTHISKFGIVHASDSNLTSEVGGPAGKGQKTFKVNHLKAGLTVAGAYSVAGTPMDVWMKDFITTQATSGAETLSGFGETLRTAFETQMSSEEKQAGSMVHIAGYVRTHNGVHHPEFYYVRNVYGIATDTGEYFDVRDQFVVSEDF